MIARVVTGLLRRLLPGYEPYAYTIDRLRPQRELGETARAVRGQLVDVQFCILDLPRMMLWCRLLRHRPVVDGVGYGRPLWVCCRRCGVRGRPQGTLNPQNWRIGAAYRGVFDPRVREGVTAAAKRGEAELPQYYPPGVIDPRPTGMLGGQLVIGGGTPVWGWRFTIGDCDGERTFAAGVWLGWLGSAHLHVGEYGLGLVRALGLAHTARITGLQVGDGYAVWQLWAPDETGCRKRTRLPWWRSATVNIGVAGLLLGRRRHDVVDVAGGRVSRTLRMPDGDYPVLLQLQEETVSRPRQWWRQRRLWNVCWSTVPNSIPVKRATTAAVSGSGVKVPHRSVCQGTWAAEAVAAITAQVTAMRTVNGWDPLGEIPIPAVRPWQRAHPT